MPTPSREAKHAKQLEVQVKALAAKDKENRELARKYQESAGRNQSRVPDYREGDQK